MSMAWVLANRYGILVDEPGDAWHTGHVNALLPVSGTNDLLVGSDTGGVWSIPPTGEPARPLSNDWTDPDISTLVQGPDPSTVFAGTSHGSLYVSDAPGGGGGFLGAFRKADTLDANGNPIKPGTIWAGVFESSTKRLVLACDAGLLWAEVPLLPGADYVFHSSVGPAGTSGPFSGVALGPTGTVIAAGKGPGLSGLFTAKWSNNDLFVTASAVTGVNVGSMTRTSVASCPGSERFAYAITAQRTSPKDVVFLAVLRSTDGGGSWQVCPMSNAISSAFGNQGDYNQAIAVAPNAAATKYQDLRVAAGMRRGPMVSIDGGDTWFENGDTGSGLGRSPHLHGDLHFLWFDPQDLKSNTLFVGSDGGVARTRTFDGLAHVHSVSEGWESRPFNRLLPILQFNGSNTPTFRGGASAAASLDFLVGGGTQDNNTLWSIADSAPTPWRAVEKKGDGGYLTFVATDSVGTKTQGLGIATDANAAGEMLATAWNATDSKLEALGAIPISGGTGSGLVAPAGQYISLSAVRTPQWPGSKDKVLAVCGSGSGIYGYTESQNQIGQWKLLASLSLQPNEFVTAVGSRRGDPIYAGTNVGRIFAIDPAGGPTNANVLELNVKAPAGAKLSDVKMILDLADDLTIAAYNAKLFRRKSLQFSEVPGTGLPATQFRSIASDPTGRILFAAFDDGVYVSTDEGDHWNPFSDGLPTMPHAAELSVAVGANAEYLYLATWGRSMYVHEF
jgi:hypothetical protein